MLSVERINVFYGRAHALYGVSFSLARGETLVLLGRNGAGKSTTLKTLIGLLRAASGHIVFDGHDITRAEPHRIARLGLGYVPEDRRIFAELTVAENLLVGRRAPRDGVAPWTPDRLFALFPNLASMHDRLGARMSGGEQQMLAIARTLMGNPRAILLDEPSEGLAPVILDQLVTAIRALREQGVTILLAEQNFRFAARIAERAALIETGRIVWIGTPQELADDVALRNRYLGV
jgi:branched-chain amino acid transport system ATP-binding protein